MKCKLFVPKIAFSFFLAAAVFISCSSPVEVKERFAFETALRPGNDGVSDLANRLNGALIEQARKSGKDSTLVIQSDEKNKAPFYEDIAFLPVISAEELEDIIGDHADKGFRTNQQDFSAQIGAIDFKKNFVLLIGHPKTTPSIVLGEMSTSQAIYIDKVMDGGSDHKNRHIELVSKRLGDAASGEASLMQKWESKVYILDYKDCDSLQFEIDKNIYSFSLKK